VFVRDEIKKEEKTVNTVRNPAAFTQLIVNDVERIKVKSEVCRYDEEQALSTPAAAASLTQLSSIVVIA
jgi:hypothetical protein